MAIEQTGALQMALKQLEKTPGLLDSDNAR